MTPRFAHIYIENRCNLKCDHCYETEETHPFSSQLTLQNYNEIFRQLAEVGVFIVTFSGGEPFLRRDFLDIVALARRYRFAVRIYTSGTLITPAKARRLRDLKVQEVHISVYSHLASIHDNFTGVPRSHAKSVAALQLLRDNGIRTVLKTSVMTFNVDALDELIALARSVGADYRFDPTVKPKMNGDRSPLRYAVSPEELRRKVLWRSDLASTMSFEDAEGICNGENHRSGANGGMCAAGTKLITVNADGTVSPCAMFPVAGPNFQESSIGEIWHDSELFNQVRSQKFDDMSDCPRCEVQSSCDPCMAYALIENGDMKTCNTSSRQFATGKALLAGAVIRGTHKNTRGRPLPIVGNVSVASPFPEGHRLSTEQ